MHWETLRKIMGATPSGPLWLIFNIWNISKVLIINITFLWGMNYYSTFMFYRGETLLHLFSLQTDLAILHHLSGGILLSINWEVNLFLYSVLASLPILLRCRAARLWLSSQHSAHVTTARWRHKQVLWVRDLYRCPAFGTIIKALSKTNYSVDI